MIVDKMGRQFRNLRVSLTSACNFACTYCVPNGKRLIKAKDELGADQLHRAVQLLQLATGIDRLRITGGEPLVAAKFDSFLLKIMELGLKDVSLTTNAQLLKQKIPVIKRSGLKRINISLDTLHPLKFKQIARGGDLNTVLSGIEAVLDLGLQVKINMVPLATANGDQILPLLNYCLDRGIELRYIELMRMGHVARDGSFAQDFISMASLLDQISQQYEFIRIDAPLDSTAIRYEIPNRGRFGIIANESQPFCSACTRLRLAADGRLYGCLSNAAHQSILPVLHQPNHIALPRLQRMLMDALGHKQSHVFTGGTTVMKMIGG